MEAASERIGKGKRVSARAAKTGKFVRMAWQDRFTRPSVEELRNDLHGPRRQAFDALIDGFRELGQLTEFRIWHGDCWRWTVEFRAAGSIEPLAAIIPCPTDLQLAMPLSREFARSLPLNRLKRSVRDGLELAQEPFDSHWCVWSIDSAGLVDDLLDLVELKQQHLVRRAV